MQLKRIVIVKIICLTAITVACFTNTAASQYAAKVDKRPNILLIMADDLGYSDIGCYGGEIKTPNLDNLAKNGLRFSQFYNASRCCPTRASLLTGLYSHQAGMGDMSNDQGAPGYRGYLTENTVTLAEVLKTAGYQTGMIGKWHLSNTPAQSTKEKHLAWLNHQTDYPVFAPLDQYPVNRGFDKFYGTIWGVVNFFDPFSLVNGTAPVKSVDKDYYYTDAINDSAANYIRQFAKNEAPFFLYVAHTAPHWPLHALPEDIERYKEVYKAGWDVIRNARYEKMIREGLFDEKQAALSARWREENTWMGNIHKEWDAYAMAVRAAMVDRMDKGIGQIIQTLKETGQLDNTLILFLSDNGASSDDAQNYGPGFDRPGETRSGEAIIYPVRKQVLPGPETTFASANEMWSNVANTPFRYWKTKAFEGGICTPLIVSWPKGLTVKKGGVTNQTGHVIDFMATFSELAGARYPQVYKSSKITPTEGLSLVPIFKGKQRKGHQYLFFEHLNSKAVRNGDWKLVSLNEKSDWELYNLKTDRTEMNNLARQNSAMVEKLKAKWYDWANKSKVLPKPLAANGMKK